MSIEYVCDVAPPIRQRTPRGELKLCYRCGERFSIIDGAADHSRGNSAFERHEEKCLARAIEADQRRRAT